MEKRRKTTMEHNVIRDAERLIDLTEGNLSFEQASWLGIALRQQEEGTYNPEEWIELPGVGMVLKAEVERL
jgi:hypothetical protein